MSPLIQAWLTRHQIAHRLHDHAALKSFDELSAALNFPPRAMVKALVFVDPAGRCILAAMPGAAKTDYKRIADTAGCSRAQLRRATPDELRASLDAEAGGVAPVALNGALLLIDAGVAGLDRIYCGTGRVGSTLEMAAADWLRAAEGTVGAFAKA